MFHEPPHERSFPTTAVVIAAVAIIILVVVLVGLGRRHGEVIDPSKPQAAAAYAANLAFSRIDMSASSNMAGGTSTYIDGHVQNNGPQTVTGITMQLSFPSDVGPAQLLTAPVQIIRIREPEVDTEPVSAAPIAPGKGADFRLIFETVGDQWNNKQPGMQAIAVSTK